MKSKKSRILRAWSKNASPFGTDLATEKLEMHPILTKSKSHWVALPDNVTSLFFIRGVNKSFK